MVSLQRSGPPTKIQTRCRYQQEPLNLISSWLKCSPSCFCCPVGGIPVLSSRCSNQWRGSFCFAHQRRFGWSELISSNETRCKYSHSVLWLDVLPWCSEGLCTRTQLALTDMFTVFTNVTLILSRVRARLLNPLSRSALDGLGGNVSFERRGGRNGRRTWGGKRLGWCSREEEERKERQWDGGMGKGGGSSEDGLKKKGNEEN